MFSDDWWRRWVFPVAGWLLDHPRALSVIVAVLLVLPWLVCWLC